MSTYTNSKEANMLEKFVFDFLTFNIFAIEVLYRVFPALGNIIPSNISVIVPVAVAAALIVFNSSNLKKISIGMLVLFLICLSYLVVGFLGNEYIKGNTLTPNFLVVVIFSLFLFTRNDIQGTISHLKWVSVVISVLLCLLAITSIGVFDYSVTTQYMTIGYGLSLQAIILFELANNKIERIYPMFLTVMIVLFGNRGAFLVVIAYLVYVILNQKMSKKRRYIISFATIVIVLFIVAFWTNIIEAVYQTTTQLGISSRTINKLIQSSFVTDSDRSYIRRQALDIIRANPLKIRGPGYMTTISISLANKTSFSTNAHNVALQLIVEYGVILGSVLLIILYNQFFVALRIRHNSNRELSISFMTALLFQSYVMLLFSNSLYFCNELWMGLVLFVINKRIVKDESISEINSLSGKKVQSMKE